MSTNEKFALICGAFNREVTDMLLQDACETLRENGITDEDMDCIWVPGAFEIPQAAKLCAKSGKYRAIITLGAVIRGETPHFEFVARACADGVAALTLQYDLPIIFGVLTTNFTREARVRSEGKNNKGADAARAALKMAGVIANIK